MNAINVTNVINVIAPDKHLGMWVFDDPRVGLVQEPFVGGSDTNDRSGGCRPSRRRAWLHDDFFQYAVSRPPVSS